MDTPSFPIPLAGSTRNSTIRGWWDRVRTSFFWMVAVAFLLRISLILLGHTYKFKTAGDNFSFGWEMGRIGRSLALGQGFSNPFNEITGITAWEPPLYPYLISAVFRLTGVYTHASAIVLLGINSLFSALTCIPTFLIARRCFEERLAVWSGWMWALLPWTMFWATRWVWETSLAALLLTTIFWLSLNMEENEGNSAWIVFGLLWGVAALTNTSLLAFLPASGLWAWCRRSRKNKASIVGIILSAMVFVACITPWLVRDYRAFDQFIFIRDNFGVELRIGNSPGADGTWREYLHPTQNVFEMRRFQQMGELAYVADRRREAVEFIRADYWRFLGISFKRLVYYWAGPPRLALNAALAPFKNSVFLATSVLAIWGLGRALRKHQPGAWLFLWLFMCYPLIYYFVFPHPRYRHPIEPEIGILMLYVISEAEIRRKGLNTARVLPRP